MFKIIILDFDGVIVESVGIKTEAFRALFADDYPRHVDEFVRFHRAHNGMSRYGKIDHFFRHFLHREPEEEEREYWANRFSRLVVDKVVACPLVPGAREFIEECSGRIPLYVASVVPRDELEEIIRRRGLAPFFTGIFGTIKKKAGIIIDILSVAEVVPREAFFVGDTREDFVAARETGVFMLGRRNMDDFTDMPIPVCDNMHGAREWVRAHADEFGWIIPAGSPEEGSGGSP